MVELPGTLLRRILYTQKLSDNLFKCRQEKESRVMENLKKTPKMSN